MAAEILDYLNEAGYEGVNYVPQRPSLRVRLHNWLIRLGEADDADKCP